MRRTLPSGAISVLVVAALVGCVGDGGVGFGLTVPGSGASETRRALPLFLDDGAVSARAASDPDAPAGQGSDTSSAGRLASTAVDSSRGPAEPDPDPFGRRSNIPAGTDRSGPDATDEEFFPPGSAVVKGTEPSGLSPPEGARDNREAADLLDHWGHRRVQGIVEGLSLGTAAPQVEGAGTQVLRPGALTGAGRLLPRELGDGDEVRLLGSRHGVTYGRWTGGPADTLAIEFDVSRAGREMRYDPAFRAMLERAGKAWSRRIADTLATWERAPGDYKGRLQSDDRPESRVFVGTAGETSARLEIDVKDNDISGGFAGRGGGSWERRFGTVQIDRAFLEDARERPLFEVLAHEIGARARRVDDR